MNSVARATSVFKGVRGRRVRAGNDRETLMFGNSKWLVGFGVGSLLVGCAGESLAPGEDVDGEANAGEQEQALVTVRGCEGMSVRTPVPQRFKYLHVKAGTDTTIRGFQPTTNFQNETRCYTSYDDEEVCLLRFPIALPPEAQIHFAQLAMRTNTAASAKFFASSMDLRWTEAGATCNVYKTSAEWSLPGAWNDKRGAFCTLTSGVGSFQNNLDGYAVSQIQDWVSGRAENSGIGIFSDATSNGTRLSIYSSENVPDDQPELNLWYTDEPIADHTVALGATESTTIDQSQPTKNFSTQPACEVSRLNSGGSKKEKTCLLRWDVSKIPIGSLVTRVELDFGSAPSNIVRWDAYPVRRAWVEKQATWNDFATGSAWKKAGAFDSTDVGDSGAYLQIATTGPRFKVTGSMYKLVERWVNDPSSNQGVLLSPSRSLPLLAEAWTLPKAPTLRITFTPPPWQ